MGLTIQFESHTVELGAIYQMEHDPQVLEFYDQPPPFKICYRSQSGRNIAHYHTPDFFVLRSDGAGWEEWKPEKQLKQLAEKYPTRYQRTEAGQWRCPPGEAYAEPLGLTYSVRTDAELHPVFIQNLSFLEDYLDCTPAVASSVQQQALSRVQAEPGMTLSALLACEPEVRADDIYALIAQEQLYVDLSAVPLAQPWRVMLYLDQQAQEADVLARGATITPGLWDFPASAQLMPNTSLLWDGRLWTLINLGEETTTVLPETGQPIQLPTEFFLRLLSDGTISLPKAETELSVNQEVQCLMKAASKADLAKANYRFHLVQAYLQRQAMISPDVSERTLRDWVKKFRTAEAQYGCGYVGLLPRTAKRGNRTAKAPNSSRELLDTFIADYYETPRQAPAISVYRAYQRACEQQRIPPLSTSTFYSRLRKRRGDEQTKKRQGAKAAYALQPWVWELAKSTPRHGDRPLAITHIDHTQLDIELRSQATGRLLGRPWATLLMDAYSRRILAVYLTFDAPSYRSCMMALRICVSRFGRFPQTVVVDGGKEFHSVYFDTLLARYCCIKKTRPGGKPRFGSVIERLFGTTNTEFIFNLLGNTQAAKQVRQLTKAIDPKRQAVWTLGDLYVFLKEWAYQVYDQGEHEALGTTPREAYLQGMSQAGEREHRRIPYNEEFLMATRPSTLKGEATVQPGKGIKVNYLFKEYAVSHSQLAKVDRELMRAIREPAGFAHVLVYGPSGVGKTTMIRQITRRLNEMLSPQSAAKSVVHSQDNLPLLPLLLLETRPPDGGAFNRADYYRTALKLLGEPFYERRLLVNIDSEQVWEKKGRGRSKAAQFNDSPELRHALEDAMSRRGVQAVILDEAQHLIKLGSGSSAGKLLDQLDWIKSMTNVTGVVHILIGTYELLSFRNLSGQASRRGLDLHFPRYLFQHEPDRQAFQGVLLALLKQVPLLVEIEMLMQHWVYFYERSIGCVGVLKDWLIRAVAAALYDGSEVLTLEYLQDHALSLAQCERMALDATEGEQELQYAESRREPLWQLLASGMDASAIPAPVDRSAETSAPAVPVETIITSSSSTNSPPKTTRRKRTAKTQDKGEAVSKEAETGSPVEAKSPSQETESTEKPARKKRQTRKKSQAVVETPDPPSSETATTDQKTEPTAEEPPPSKKRTRRVGQRKPKRDPVGT
jgi:putative transposase